MDRLLLIMMIGAAVAHRSLGVRGSTGSDADRRRNTDHQDDGTSTKRRFSVRSSLRSSISSLRSSGLSSANDPIKEESEHYDESLLPDLAEQMGSFRQAAAHKAREKRDSFRAGLPQSLLQTHDNRDYVAPIKLEEIKFGPKLGAGEYSNVFEIESFHLRDVHDVKTEEELEKRSMLKRCEKYRETKKARYALKRLKGDYFSGNDPEKCFQAVR